MKTIILFTLIIGSFLLTGCNNSSFGKKDKKVTTLPQPIDPIDPFVEETQNNPNFKTNHCSDVLGQIHNFYGYMKNVLNKGSYRNFIEDNTDCRSYNGWVQYRNNNYIFSQYERYEGTANCSWWNQQPMGIQVTFFKGYPANANISIDVTGDGFARTGQGFPVRRVEMGAQIQCSQEDLSIHANTPYGGTLSIVVEKERGNKNTATMRAKVFYNGALIGTESLRRQ